MFKVLGQNLVNMEQKEQAKELMIPLGNTSTSTWYSPLITIIIITIITMFAIIRHGICQKIYTAGFSA